MRHEPLRERLRERRWRITPQRRSVVEALTGPNLHLTAEGIFARARAVVPEISRATVYNTLRELVEMGELAEMQIGPGPVLYDPNAVVRHHHLVCSNCGHIHDIHPLGVEHLGLRKEDHDGFELQRVEVVFHGRCRACKESEDT
jgi:Fur family transcriptional regulator, stress-responsive regulator